MLVNSWAKSTRSNPSGNCVEARWKKSTKSWGGGENCVETRWTKSTRSSSTNCVEVRGDSYVIQVRDTKDKGNGPILDFSPDAWQHLIDFVKSS